jgi:hypothetical protein
MTEPDPRWDDEGIPETADDATPERARVPDPQEASLPAELPLVSTDFGTTVQERRAGEGLDRKLARERPELTPDEAAAEDEAAQDPDDPGGRDGPGEEKAIANGTRSETGLSPEERAIHLEE